MDAVLELQQAADPANLIHPDQAPEVGPGLVLADFGLPAPPAVIQHAEPYIEAIYIPFHIGAFLTDHFRYVDLLLERGRDTKPDKDGLIHVVRVTKVGENKQARDRHVLGLLTSLRAVFPGDVTEKIARKILPHAKYDVVPDELQLKQPTKEKRKVFSKKEQVHFDKKGTAYRKHQASYHRR